MTGPRGVRRRGSRSPRWSARALPAAAILLLLGGGCGPAGPKVVPISGTATRGGQPVAGIELTFHPETGRPSWANTDGEGRFTLSYSRDRNGAVLGRHRVTVRGQQPSSPEEELAGKIKHPPEVRAIVGRYGDVKETPLVIEITRGRSDLVVPLD